MKDPAYQDLPVSGEGRQMEAVGSPVELGLPEQPNIPVTTHDYLVEIVALCRPYPLAPLHHSSVIQTIHHHVECSAWGGFGKVSLIGEDDIIIRETEHEGIVAVIIVSEFAHERGRAEISRRASEPREKREKSI